MDTAGTANQFWTRFVYSLAIAAAALQVGCGPSYRQLRFEGQQAVINGSPGAARVLFAHADDISPRQVENLHDLGACAVLLARQKFAQGNPGAAQRELDTAIGHYSAAIQVHPAHQASLEGKNVALELKGQFEEALKHAEWAAEFVGPSARQYLFLARELDERGDKDGAFLRYRQAIAMQPKSAEAHAEFARFLIKCRNESGAVHHLQTAYRLDPRDEWVQRELAMRGEGPLTARTTSNDPEISP